MKLVYLDTETTGLDPMRHEPWEIAFAIGDGPIVSSFTVPDHFGTADLNALSIGGFHRRYSAPDEWDVVDFDAALREALTGATICGANPGFDAAMLRHQWWGTTDRPDPWHYRLFDVEVYAMAALGHEVPHSLATIRRQLVDLGHEDIPEPDHTAAGDVATVRAVHHALRGIYQSFATPTTEESA